MTDKQEEFVKSLIELQDFAWQLNLEIKAIRVPSSWLSGVSPSQRIIGIDCNFDCILPNGFDIEKYEAAHHKKESR